ncbi:lactosylceramide 4-alpha-galactosyltransferase-like [Agrilus planipennis]|uniref:Lactosylceramide 4-alpha-galactosyltransferase-like n=1 Tax=Agrilus planipennis TaxID=224129 RepID=A0A1W4WGB2_AGRPL|nr:lactosylceramide 4-alpha-galactosyltransferase-like [Agrilus planipennis]XP_018322939.1 lactosylceramide 4-alpha-galactosyltransferase-like [Agrilus planipennis]XP_018322949.1 lactosylceramide 4-alpha-galactosyltransferase-like [Agrilus planipennis]XP_018322957.1 lactosylceramide 4-alpha-galactosyltransferase-like [Agrilus planipennis]XP_018322964.1 lactosylceramide 4-alpha-galactosyltransferase-like [Agrilus planipennis]XP_018322974.1 lactosylceramide 4-alpha-galactosyltransferase-like [Ag
MPRFAFYHLVNVLNRNRKRPCLLTLLIISLLTTIIIDIIFINSIQTFLYPFESLSCYRIENLNTFPDISQINPREGKTIFFHETSCKSHTEGKTILSSRQACAVESAAKSNPHFDVFVLFTSPGVFINNNTQSDRSIKALLTYPNIKFLHVNYNNYTEGTPVGNLYKSGKIETSYYAISHASDVLRYLTLWKYGGIYLDLDVIVMRSLEGLHSNYAGAESDDNVAAGVMNFASDGLGHFLAEECLLDLSEHFTGYDWGYNGPGVITR